MQAIILAAGEGVRMRPLTLTAPKPLLPVAGRPILEHIFAALPDEIDEVILVVRHLGEQIKNYCGISFYGRRIIYAEGSPLGTAYSFLAAAPHLREERFLFIYGDELPARQDIIACLSHPAGIVCWEVSDPWNHGVAVLRPDGTIAEILEKPQNPPSPLIADGVMALNKKIFEFEPAKGGQSEFYFTDMVNHFVKAEPTVAVRSKRGIGGLSTPADLARVEKLLAQWEHQL